MGSVMGVFRRARSRRSGGWRAVIGFRHDALRGRTGPDDAEAAYQLGAQLSHAATRSEPAKRAGHAKQAKAAERCLRSAAEAGHGRACYTLALHLASRRRFADALPWMRKAAAHDIPEACEYVEFFATLAGVAPDPAVPELATPPAGLTASYLLLWGKAQRGDTEAMAQLGFGLAHTSPHAAVGRAWLEASAERGHHAALYDLAALAFGNGDDSKAGYWSLRASARGLVQADEILRAVLPRLQILAAREELDIESRRLLNEHRARHATAP
ncbi:hypothetical protein GCM10023205_33870 [Yinghuangia aomiensis]|uniref:Sel1 repeat family protein n=1 Tax=Yinghuangia aomiensis TaxID=676205 RepID=A0ABP9HBF3_9ACTN